MIGFDVLTKAITLAGSAISTKRANDEAEKAANEHYADQQAYLSAQANSDAMATTAAKVAMGAIDKSEQRAQERERNMRAVTGGTEMASMRSKQMASDARAETASNIHQQQQKQKLKYDTMLQQSKQAEYEERQARIDAKRQSAQNMVQNAMQIGAMAGAGLGEHLSSTGAGGAPKSIIDNGGGGNGNGTTGGGITNGQVEMDNMEGGPGYIKATTTANPVIADTTGLSIKTEYGSKPDGMSDLRWRALQRKARGKYSVFN